MIFGEILLELRAIRLGLQHQLSMAIGSRVDLLEAAKLEKDSGGIPVKPRKPRTRDAIVHRNSEHLIRQQRLRESGDDTNRMIEQIREAFGDEKADQLRQFYEKEIIGKQ